MCACGVDKTPNAEYGRPCSETGPGKCLKVRKCISDERVNVPVLGFERDITDSVLSRMATGVKPLPYYFPWDEAAGMLRLQTPNDLLLNRNTVLEVRRDPGACRRELSSMVFTVICREQLLLDVQNITQFCEDASKVLTIFFLFLSMNKVFL